MGLKPKLLAAAIAASAVVGSAHAVVASSFNGIHNPAPDNEVGSETLLDGGVFEGKFEFSLTETSFVRYNGMTSEPFAALVLFDSSGTFQDGALISGTTFDEVNQVILQPGDYYYQVQAFQPITGLAFYTFESQVAVIPEPEVYAMFLAGLGMLGAVARRRLKNR